MEYLAILLVAVGTFVLCFIADKIFNRLFRHKSQHRSGMRVKANKRYASLGIILAVLGIAALCYSYVNRLLLLIVGITMVVVGGVLVFYYLSYGIYYDDESFIYSALGRKDKCYKHGDIIAQQLYYSNANAIIELHLSDGYSIQLQSSMDGFYDFMNKAFAGWVKQNNKKTDDCQHYDPHKYSWFPSLQEE